MATRYNYTGQLITDGLVLNLDAAKRDSYPGSGTTWYDLSGNGNNGTLTNGPTYTGVSKDAAIVFDGVDDYVSCSISTPLVDNVNSFSWVKTTTTSQNTILGRYGYSTFPNERSWYIGTYTGGKFQIIASPDGTNFNRYIGPTVNDNTWRHLGFTFSSGKLTPYINGTPSDYSQTGSNTINSLYNTSAPLLVGAADNGTGNNFSGSVAVGQIYNQTLTQFDIWQNFNALKGRYGIPDIVTDGLVLNLDAGNPYSYLSGSSGTTWTDVSGEGNDGTLTNGASYENGAMVFDGVDDYAEVTTRNTNLEFQPTEEYSCMVFYKSPPSPQNGALIANMVSSSPFTGWDIWFNNNSISNTIAMHFVSSWSANAIKVAVDYNYSTYANQWVCLGYTYDGSCPTNTTDTLNSVDFYLNGSLYTTGKQLGSTAPDGDGFNSSSETITYNTSQRFRVASRWSSGGYDAGSANSTGIVLVYNRKLTAAEMEQNFNALRGRYGI